MSKLTPIVVGMALALGVASTGCVGSAEVRATAVVSTPRLVWIAPGVWVVEDYHSAVFFYDGYYWMFDDGLWYRSTYYTDGFVRVAVVPPVVVSIRRPRTYVRYHAPRGAKVRVIQRDHRPRTRAAPAPRTRDHRTKPTRRRR